MKRVTITLAVITMLAFAACSDKPENEGDSQVQDPVMNSGPETEAEMAKEAVKDSARAGEDSTIRRDADAPSTPH